MADEPTTYTIGDNEYTEAEIIEALGSKGDFEKATEALVDFEPLFQALGSKDKEAYEKFTSGFFSDLEPTKNQTSKPNSTETRLERLERIAQEEETTKIYKHAAAKHGELFIKYEKEFKDFMKDNNLNDTQIDIAWKAFDTESLEQTSENRSNASKISRNTKTMRSSPTPNLKRKPGESMGQYAKRMDDLKRK